MNGSLSSTERGEHTPGIVERLRATAIQPYPYIYRNPDGPEAADLISELLGALRGCVEALRIAKETTGLDQPAYVIAAERAIAKARGGAA